MERIWKCKIGGEVGDLPAGADGPMRRAVQTAFETLTGVEASFTFSGWGATLTEGERAAHENREPNWDAMQEAIDAGDGTLHGAIEYWHEEALRLRAELAEWKATTPAPKPDCRTCSKYLPPIYAFSEPACPRRKISMDPCINGSHYRPADPVRLYETGGE